LAIVGEEGIKTNDITGRIEETVQIELSKRGKVDRISYHLKM